MDNYFFILYFGETFYVSSFLQKEIIKDVVKRSYYVRVPKSREPAKNDAYIYCRNFINFYEISIASLEFFLGGFLPNSGDQQELIV
jgi:hypothetical protein